MKRLSLPFAILLSVAVFAQETKPADSLQTEVLKEVVISFQAQKKANDYKIDSNIAVSKLPLKELENPQVYNSISKNVLQDQVVTNLHDGLKNATGITRLWESTGRGGDGAEFYTMRGFSVQPTLTNGVANISNGTVDPANIESIDVMKGPSGTLYGGSLISYGGLINITTKKPYEKFGGELGYVLGNYGLNRITGDINTPLNKNTFFRLNTAYHSENSFQDAGFYKSIFVAPSLKFVASDKLTFYINTEFKNSESANAPMVFLSRYSRLSFSNMDVFEKNYRKSYTSNDLTMKNTSSNLQGQAFYKISRGWTSQTILSKSDAATDGYYHYLWDAANGSDFTRYIARANGQTNTLNLQQNFIGDHSFGKIRNRIVIGVDYLNKEVRSGGTGWVANGVVSLKDQTDSGVLHKQGVDALVSTSNQAVSMGETKIVGAYISDVVNITPSLSAMLSLRADRFSGKSGYYSSENIKSQTNFSPKLGLVYQPVLNKWSLFANYMNGFSNLDPVAVSNLDGSNKHVKIFSPEKANQWEVGTKLNLYKEKISIVASYYDILVSNRPMTDPKNPNNQIQGGQVKSNGYEVSVVANPISGLNIIAGYSKNNSKVTKDAAENGYLNLRPEDAGPATLINFWANYKVQQGVLKNWGLGLGANHASGYNTLNRSTTGSFGLPSYTVFNSVVSYSAKSYTLQVKVDNLTNVKYYTGWSTITAQKLRSVSLGLTYKF